MTADEKITHNFATLELVERPGGRSTSHGWIAFFHDGISVPYDKDGIVGWVCRRCVLLVAVGLLGLPVGWSSSEALGAVEVLERSYNHFSHGRECG